MGDNSECALGKIVTPGHIAGLHTSQHLCVQVFANVFYELLGLMLPATGTPQQLQQLHLHGCRWS